MMELMEVKLGGVREGGVGELEESGIGTMS